MFTEGPVGTAAVFGNRHLQNRTIREGDYFSLLIENNGPGGFYTEIARTIVLGKASNQLIDGFESMKEAQAHTLARSFAGAGRRASVAVHDRAQRLVGVRHYPAA